MFLQESHIPSTFTNVSHTTTSLKEAACIKLPTRTPNEHSLKQNTESSCTQSVQPALGFTLAKVCRAENNPTLTVPQILEIKPCREYTDNPIENTRQLICNTAQKIPAACTRGTISWPKSFARKK